MLQELCQYIGMQTDLVIGDTLACGRLETTSPDTCVVVMESVAAKASIIDPSVMECPYHIISRSLSYWTARNNAYKVYNILHSLIGVTLPVVTSGIQYRVETQTDMRLPYWIGADDKGLSQFSLNFMFHATKL